MKIKFAALLIAFLIGLTPVMAQPPHSCGLLSLTVIYPTVDNMGIAPRPAPGSEAVFTCIAAHDPAFDSQRFSSAWQAANYWLTLMGQELGQPVIVLPPPTN